MACPFLGRHNKVLPTVQDSTGRKGPLSSIPVLLLTISESCRASPERGCSTLNPTVHLNSQGKWGALGVQRKRPMVGRVVMGSSWVWRIRKIQSGSIERKLGQA